LLPLQFEVEYSIGPTLEFSAQP